MSTCAFVTYNAVGDGLANGWHDGAEEDRRAFVLQNTKGEGTLSQGPIGRARRHEEADLLWQQLQQELGNLDHVVVYVGTTGAERILELVSGIPTDKVTLVGCDCNIERKQALREQFGLGACRALHSECGGHVTMYALYALHMAGQFPPPPA